MKYKQQSNDKHGLVFWALLIFMALMASCSKNESEPIEESPSSNLIGKWYYESDIINGERFEYDKEMFDNCSVPKEEYIEFKNKGEFVAFYYTGCEDDFNYAEYSLNGDELSITSQGTTSKGEIKELTFTSLVFQFNVDRDGDGDLDTVIQSFYR